MTTLKTAVRGTTLPWEKKERESSLMVLIILSKINDSF